MPLVQGAVVRGDRTHKEATMTKKTHTTRKEQELAPPQPLSAAERHEQVARKAYELYEQRGAGHGQDWADWFMAERSLQEAPGEDPLPQATRKGKKR